MPYPQNTTSFVRGNLVGQLAWFANPANHATGRSAPSSDVLSALGQWNRDNGSPLKFADFTAVNSLYSQLTGMYKAADALNAAPSDAAITGNMVSEPPWARELNQQVAAPAWQATVSVTYQAPDGTVVTTQSTVPFTTTLPATKGELMAQVQQSVQDNLSRSSVINNTGGTVVSVSTVMQSVV